MVTQQLLDFITTQRQQGKTDDQIKTLLLTSNWSEQDVNQAFDHLKQGIPVPPSPASGTSSEMDMNTKTIIVVLLLLSFPPIGLILMWLWMKQWPGWVKILVTLPVFLAIGGIILAMTLTLANPLRKTDYSVIPTPRIYMSVTPSPIPSRDFCKSYDGNVNACDDHGVNGCAYYFCSQQCWPSGTENETACPTTPTP